MKKTEAQIPAVGIMQTHDFGDSKYYRIACKCGQEKDDINMNVEVDECDIAVHTYVTVSTCWWRERFNTFDSIHNPFMYTTKKIANDVINRAMIIWTVLTKGYVEMESWTSMNEQQALNYAETLKSAIEDVKAFRSKREEKAALVKASKKQNVDDVLTDKYDV
jgi:flagellar hook-basal body complex protein FliE